jgi:hypothetical protein
MSLQVSLDIPDKLFGSSFNTVTKVSTIVGDLMTVRAFLCHSNHSWCELSSFSPHTNNSFTFLAFLSHRAQHVAPHNFCGFSNRSLATR